MLLDQVIKQRLHGCETSDDGNLWELREVISLPFPCKKNLYNRIGNEIPNYLLRENKKGYAWGYFWVVAEHVGQKNEGPKTIRCKASSDDEDETDEEDFQENQSSQMDSCEDDEIQNMSVQYESMSDDGLDTSVEEIERNLQHKNNNLVTLDTTTELNCLNERCFLLQQSLEQKNLEISQMKQHLNDSNQKMADYDSLKENIGKNAENLQLQQILHESNKHVADYDSLKENIGKAQQSLESKNLEICQLQRIVHENNQRQEQIEKAKSSELSRLNERIHQLAKMNQEKVNDCFALTDELKILKQTFDCKNTELLTLEAKLKKEKEQRAVDKKSICAANRKTKEQSQKLKKMETELKKATVSNDNYEMDLQEKQQNIQELESTVRQIRTEIKTRQLQLEELQLVINWKDEQYKKIQLELQERIMYLENETKNQSSDYEQKIKEIKELTQKASDYEQIIKQWTQESFFGQFGPKR